MEESLKNWKKLLEKGLAKRKFYIDTITHEKKMLETSIVDSENSNQAQDIIQTLAKTTQEYSHSQIAKIVSKCLSAVFEKPYTVNIEFDKKRGKTEARVVYQQGENKLSPLLTSGGVKDLTSFALRIASLVLSMPKTRKLLVLDEPFKAVSATNRPKIESLLTSLCTELKMQIIIITHDPELNIGKVIHF